MTNSIKHGAAGVPTLFLPDVRAGDHALRSLVLSKMRQGIPPVQMPSVQREIKIEGSQGNEEQCAANQPG